jgi:DNA-binding MarR family transcriptional regulator
MSTAEKPPPERAATLGFLLRELYDVLQDRVYAAVAADGHPDIRELHSPVLRQMPPDGARVADLARQAGLAKQSVAYIVDDLAKLGYVTIGPDPADGRAKRVKLTARGRALSQSLIAHSATVERELAVTIGAKKVAALRGTLADAAVALAALDERGSAR